MNIIYSAIPNKDSVKIWDRQIRLFARYFLAYGCLPRCKFTILDAGCGTGAALCEIHKVYPGARLFGCDLEAEHIEICKRMNHKCASFFQADIIDIEGHYDIIYISNVIEHLKNWQEVVTHLTSCCDRLYVFVPYKEHLDDQSAAEVDGIRHLNNFNRRSFDFMRAKEVKIESKIIRTPYAWGHPFTREIFLRAKAFIRQENFDIRREILFAITNNWQNNSKLSRKPFFNKLKAWANIAHPNSKYPSKFF